MNRLNIFWVILLIYVMSFFLITSTEVKHTAYYELEPVNFNGYLPLYVEDYLLSKDYVTFSSFNGLITYTIGNPTDVFYLRFSNVLVYIEDVNLEGYYMVDHMLVSWFINSSYHLSVTIGTDIITSSGVDYLPLIEIIGVSNYEVIS